MAIYIGTSGWSYQHWHGVLYPPEAAPRERLAYYTRMFPTVEINSTFYRWSQPATFSGWRRQLPDKFRLTVKAPRGLTHVRRLYAPEDWLARMTPGLTMLGDRLGVLLIQLPPGFGYDYLRLSYFLAQLPTQWQVAIEFRHPSWHCEEIYALLERYGVAYCVMSGARLPCVLRATASFVYVRLHGPDPDHLYSGLYSAADLQWWADRLREWASQGRDVFAYFNNDGDGNAVRNATCLRTVLGV
jgi:uncharacterized protein YecE (DUF72 family)